MNKQIKYLLEEIGKILKIHKDLLIKYEYNSNVHVHFILLYSKTLDKDTINAISDSMYLNFVEFFPDSIVAIFDNDTKYEFKFESLYDNTNVDNCVVKVKNYSLKTDTILSINNLSCENNQKTINIIDYISKIAMKYNTDFIYEEQQIITPNIEGQKKSCIYNDEFAFAA
ncbi:hypothetical protein [Chryseobacterium sp. JV274]|uniref:hypothetical protein n=1 Tax=Chryseobacterium sp. JV274 TaxID=1932669 RepID=UPI0015C23B04|nr:hypothetical protein [Chryseobacterium sp. JV274]CAD0220277.1 conserved protein of unknown function [Chryseobacterium sp. JV274]